MDYGLIGYALDLHEPGLGTYYLRVVYASDKGIFQFSTREYIDIFGNDIRYHARWKQTLVRLGLITLDHPRFRTTIYLEPIQKSVLGQAIIQFKGSTTLLGKIVNCLLIEKNAPIIEMVGKVTCSQCASGDITNCSQCASGDITNCSQCASTLDEESTTYDDCSQYASTHSSSSGSSHILGHMTGEETTITTTGGARNMRAVVLEATEMIFGAQDAINLWESWNKFTEPLPQLNPTNIPNSIKRGNEVKNKLFDGIRTWITDEGEGWQDTWQEALNKISKNRWLRNEVPGKRYVSLRWLFNNAVDEDGVQKGTGIQRVLEDTYISWDIDTHTISAVIDEDGKLTEQGKQQAEEAFKHFAKMPTVKG